MQGAGDRAPDRPALADRGEILRELGGLIAGAWESFEHPRPEEPGLAPALRSTLGEPLPEEPTAAPEVLADAAEVLDESVSPARPLYLAYVGSTGLEVGVLAAAMAATYDVNLATTARTADLVERQALEWIAEFVGYPHSEGAFTSGGMISNLTALLAAREAALPGCRERGFDGRRGAIYCSSETHHSVVRAAEAAGFGRMSVRRLELDERRRMRPRELAAAIAADRAEGIEPVCVVANGGTTLTGAVDPIRGVGEVCRAERVWLHIDGAYGLPAAATDSAAPLFDGLELADSLTIDAHKWIGIQKSCSLVLVGRRGALEATYGHEESYMRREEVPNAVERTLEYSRPFRSLKPWLAFRIHGAAAIRGWIEHTLSLAREFTALIRAEPGFELLHEPTLSTVCFRHLPADGADPDEHNLELAQRIREDGRIFLAEAVVDGRTCLRVCFVNFRTRREDLDTVLATLRELSSTA
ncbi:aminotransferase class V-fold PLP-dependent enzyme [Thermoleophilia bacterium SCSIO 60948]|nr:aminotransferase class V-fold PLP-dependent enzyme [Thermoleophilia bacterium SCSIO 60948]